MSLEAEPDIAKLLAQANAALNDDDNALNVNDGDEDNVELTAQDMNDPDLLAQLAEFNDSGSDQNAIDGDDDDGDEKVFEEMKSKSLQSLKQKITNMTQKANEFRSANDTKNYKISVQCAQELKVLVSQINEMDAIQFATDKDEIEVQIAQIEEHIAQLYASNDDNNDNDNDEEASEQILLLRYKMYKFAAKKAKDANNKTLALHYLKQSKLIAKYVQEIRDGLVIWLSDVPPPLDDELWQIKVIKNDDNSCSNAAAAGFVTLQMIESRIDHYKTITIKTKNEGNIELAKQYYTQMKEMQNMIPHIKANKMKLKISDLPKKITVKKEEKIRERKLSKIEEKGYNQIIKQLKSQIEECKSDASFLTVKDKSQQSQLLQYAKQSHMMLQKVIECKKLQLETPKYEMFSINVKTLNVNSDIEENECRVIIGKLSNLSTKGSTDIYLNCELFDQKFQSSTKKVKFSADFNITKRCKIERNKKLERKIKFGRLNISLYQDKLFGDVLLGSSVLKLKPLLETSSIVEVVTIKPENIRKKIADLSVQIKLRKPVLTDGYTVISKKLLKITKFPVIQRKQMQAIAAVETKHKPKPKQKQKQKAVSEPKQKPKSKPKHVEIKASTSVSGNLPNGLTQNMVDDPLALEYIESFECISKEIELCQQEILQKGGKNCEDLNEKLQGLKTNRTILEVQVNNGILTLEQYTNKIKKAMILDLTLAKYLKGQNRKMEAVKVLQRYKTMKKEIEGA